jgi:hypothetical protein
MLHCGIHLFSFKSRSRKKEIMKICFVSSFVIGAVACSANAGFVNPLIPMWRGTADTEYMGWENFTSAYGGSNLPDAPNSNNLGGLINFGPGAVLTSTKNIYGPTGPLSITMLGGMTAAPRNPVEVVLNISAAGTVINMQSVTLSLMDNFGSLIRVNPISSIVRFDEPFQMGGRVQTLAFTWNFQPNLIAATQWQVNFSSTGANTSLDAVSLDMRFIPAPGALSVLAMLGGGGMICGRRRRL